MKQIAYSLFAMYLWSFFLVASEPIVQQVLTKSFLIAKSTKSYEEAKTFAMNLSAKSGIKIDFRGLLSDSTFGLSEAKEVCEEQGFTFPCYIARGRYDDGIYISIEYSNAYEGFSEGYYIVVVASGEIEKRLIKQIKAYVPGAYVKKSSVYMGCIH